MNLAIFDIDGTLTVSNEIDDACFVKAFRDVLGIQGMSTNWLDYEHQTDSGLALEICRKHLARDPRDGEIERLQSRFVELLIAAVEGGQSIREVDGAARLLHDLGDQRRWNVAIATGGWRESARFKLATAGLPVDTFPWASADDALDRVDILRTAIGRAKREYSRKVFQKFVYIGDEIWDVRAAKTLGIGFLGLASGKRAGLLIEEGASCVLPDFSDPMRVSECLETVARNL